MNYTFESISKLNANYKERKSMRIYYNNASYKIL